MCFQQCQHYGTFTPAGNYSHGNQRLHLCIYLLETTHCFLSDYDSDSYKCKLVTNVNETNLSGLLVSVSALRMKGWDSIPSRVIPKTKNGTQLPPRLAQGLIG